MTKESAKARYHHGDLPEALLKATAQLVAEEGVAGLSLREVARRAGVSHGAPAHHFGDKAGLLTALATQGFELFEAALTEARDAAGSDPLLRFAATGYAYVVFASTHRPHFEIMFRPELVRQDDPAFVAAGAAAYGVLRGMVAEVQAAGFERDRDPEIMAVTAWAQAHGLATLWLSGNLHTRSPSFAELEPLARAVFGGNAAVVSKTLPAARTALPAPRRSPRRRTTRR